jgi:ribosomal protein S27E
MMKKMVMIVTAVAIIAVSGLIRYTTAEAAKTQMMAISCPHCHELTTVDVMQDDVECTHCHAHIHIDG